jgi:hypothetical protein
VQACKPFRRINLQWHKASGNYETEELTSYKHVQQKDTNMKQNFEVLTLRAAFRNDEERI